MIARKKHAAAASSLGSLPAEPDEKHASNAHILGTAGSGGSSGGWRAALRRRCTRKLLRRRLPPLQWAPRYSAADAAGDAIAGVTVGLTVIPQSLAYSSIAGLPAQHGLYGSFLGCFVYIALGGCRCVPAGPTAIASLLTWQAAGGVVEKAVLLTLLSGALQLLMGLLGLGFLLDFVSGPVSSGFTSAVALMIATSQVKDLLAIRVEGATFVRQWASILGNVHEAALWDPLLGLACIALLLALRRLGMTAAARRTTPVGRALWLLATCRNALVVLGSGALGAWLLARAEADGDGDGDGEAEAPLRLMGPIPGGIPAPRLPALSYVRADNSTAGLADMVAELGSGVVVVPLIALLEDLAICKAFSGGRAVDATQEMLALGAAGVAQAFVQAFPGGGSLARSVVAAGSGARTPLNQLYTGLMVLLALQFFTQYFAYIPRAALAAIIISAILFMVEYDVVRPMWRAKKLDLVPGVGTFVLCLALRLELGILLGVAANLLFILYHAARPKFSVEMLKTEEGREYLMLTPDRCLMFPSVAYVRRLVAKHAASGSGAAAGSGSAAAPVPVVLECSHIYAADYTAATSIDQLTADFAERKQPLFFYNLKPSVCNVFGAVAPPDRFVVFYEDAELDRLLADAHARQHTNTTTTTIASTNDTPEGLA